MSKRFILCILAVLLISPVSGCVLTSQGIKNSEPATRVLEFRKPFDFVYLNTFDAINAMSGWDIVVTDMTVGQMQIRNNEYGRFGDHDKKVIMLHLLRVDSKLTAVSVEEDYQLVHGANDVLDYIESYMQRKII